MEQYDIKLFGIGNTSKKYQYLLKEDFFKLFYNVDLIEKCNIKVEVIIEENVKKRQFYFTFYITGDIRLTCDRSLDKFLLPINIEEEVIFELGEKNEEVDYNHYIVKSDNSFINIAQHLYDFIILSIPIKKLHPRFIKNSEN